MAIPFTFYNYDTKQWDKIYKSVDQIEVVDLTHYLLSFEYKRFLYFVEEENRFPVEALLLVVSERW